MENKKHSLDPMAKPYNKIPPQYPCYFYISFPQITTSYNVIHLQQPFYLPKPKQTQKQNNKDSSPQTLVPFGPRIPNSKRRRKQQQHQSQQQQWVPKNNPNESESENKNGKKRWKNRKVGYHKILPTETTTTSLMIKNIPNRYTRKSLIQTLDNHCKAENQNSNNDFVSAYDFLYLPIDFKHRLNAGFAFVNFTDSKAASKFRDSFHGKRWDLSNSPKVAEISRARIQGKDGLIKHCKVMDLSCGSYEDMPVWFGPPRDGSGRVVSKMFTIGMVKYVG